MLAMLILTTTIHASLFADYPNRKLLSAAHTIGRVVLDNEMCVDNLVKMLCDTGVVTEFHSYYSLLIFTVGSGVSGPSDIISPALAIELRSDQASFLVCNSRLVMHGSYFCSASLVIVALLLLLLLCCSLLLINQLIFLIVPWPQ